MYLRDFFALKPFTTTVHPRSAFYSSLRFTLSLQSAFYPWSAVRSLRFTLTGVLSVSRVASEVCVSRRWLKFKLDHRHSPLFSTAKLKIAIATVKEIWVSSGGKTGESEVGANSNGLLTCVCGTTTFMGGAVVIPVIMEIHTDFLCPFQTPDRTLTRRNQMLRDDDIFSKVEQKNKKTKTVGSFPF